MKLFQVASLLAFISVSSLTVSSATHAADELNLNLQTSSNIITLQEQQRKSNKCYRQCDRKKNRSDRWVRRCKRDCDAQDIDPEAQCNSLGEPCHRDSDCQQGGFDPCMKCGDERGTEYFRRCYGGIKRETPAPVPPPPPQCNTYDEPCERDSDCAQGGFNPCTKCGKSRGTSYYKRCYDGSEQEDSLEFIQSDELVEDNPTWDDMKNGTQRAAEDAADWGKKAADETAEGAKDAANKIDEWGKKTFDDNSGDPLSSRLAALTTVTVLAGMQLTGFDLW